MEVEVEIVVVEWDVVDCEVASKVEWKGSVVWLVDVVEDCVTEVQVEVEVVVTGSCSTVVEVKGIGSWPLLVVAVVVEDCVIEVKGEVKVVVVEWAVVIEDDVIKV